MLFFLYEDYVIELRKEMSRRDYVYCDFFVSDSGLFDANKFIPIPKPNQCFPLYIQALSVVDILFMMSHPIPAVMFIFLYPIMKLNDGVTAGRSVGVKTIPFVEKLSS